MNVSYLPDHRRMICAEMQIESFNFVVTAQTYNWHPSLAHNLSLLKFVITPFSWIQHRHSTFRSLSTGSIQHWFIPLCFPPTPLYLFSQSYLFEAFSYA
jgi:hypothetical protein